MDETLVARDILRRTSGGHRAPTGMSSPAVALFVSLDQRALVNLAMARPSSGSSLSGDHSAHHVPIVCFVVAMSPSLANPCGCE